MKESHSELPCVVVCGGISDISYIDEETCIVKLEKQFTHMRLPFRVDIFCSWERALNFEQAYRGCLSTLQRMQNDYQQWQQRLPGGRLFLLVRTSFFQAFLGGSADDDSDA